MRLPYYIKEETCKKCNNVFPEYYFLNFIGGRMCKICCGNTLIELQKQADDYDLSDEDIINRLKNEYNLSKDQIKNHPKLIKYKRQRIQLFRQAKEFRNQLKTI